MKLFFLSVLAAAGFFTPSACAQIFLSGGTYSQNFDSLSAAGTVNWMNNFTLKGWYAAKGAADAPTYIAGAGTGTTGSIYSFGTNDANGLADRALGSVAGSSTSYAYGVRLVNDTTNAQTNFIISFTGEQWRSANLVANTLAFSYQISSLPLTNADAVNAQTWTSFSALDFISPNTNGGSAVDGNLATNRQIFTNVVLAGVVVLPAQEIFLRWRDVDDSGSDAGIAIDDLTVTFQSTANAPPPNTNAPVITAQPQNVAAGENGFAIFSVGATGNPSPNFLWQFNGTNLPGQTAATLALNNLTTNQSGNYSVIVTNASGGTNSFAATLLVTPVSFAATNGAIRLLQYNVEGNGATDWTFGDTFIQSVIASRFPILNSASHLHTANLNPFGYTNSSSQNADNFTRDLFEAQVAVPNWPLPLHVFVAHLKSTTSPPFQDSADKRAAEASAVSNYFATVFLAGTNAAHPYVLDGDMNEDAFFPESNHYASGHPIQRLTAPPTGLQMTVPVNFFTHTDLTESIQGTLDTRFDYILPCGMLFSNIAAGEVFRTDLLTNFPSNLFSNDDKIASDHLPVLMVFKNPFNTPFKLLSITRTNQNLALAWESQNNRTFNIEASSNLSAWTSWATNLQSATNAPFVFTTNSPADGLKFFRVYRVP